MDIKKHSDCVTAISVGVCPYNAAIFVVILSMNNDYFPVWKIHFGKGEAVRLL